MTGCRRGFGFFVTFVQRRQDKPRPTQSDAQFMSATALALYHCATCWPWRQREEREPLRAASVVLTPPKELS